MSEIQVKWKMNSWTELSWTLKRSFYSGPWMETYKSCKESLCSGGYEWQAFLLTAETGTISWEVLWMFIDKSYKENFSEICLNKTKENLDHFHFVLHLYTFVHMDDSILFKFESIKHRCWKGPQYNTLCMLEPIYTNTQASAKEPAINYSVSITNSYFGRLSVV